MGGLNKAIRANGVSLGSQEQPTKMQKQRLLDRPDIQPVAFDKQLVQPERDLLQLLPSRFAGTAVDWLDPIKMCTHPHSSIGTPSRMKPYYSRQE